jgi:hypothetical protein
VTQVAVPTVNRSLVRIVVIILCVIALIIIGLVILFGHMVAPHAKDWICAGFLVIALALACGLL